MDIISLIETQINPALLDETYHIPDQIMALELIITSLDNNENELIAKY